MKIRLLIIASALVLCLVGNASAFSTSYAKNAVFTDTSNPWMGAIFNGVATSPALQAQADTMDISFSGTWYGLSPAGLFTTNTPVDGTLPAINFKSGASEFALAYMPTGGSLQINMLQDIEGQDYLLNFNNVEADFAYAVSGDTITVAFDSLPSVFSFAAFNNDDGSKFGIESLIFIGEKMASGFLGSHQLAALSYNPTPIPGSALLLLSGLAGMVGIRRMRSA